VPPHKPTPSFSVKPNTINPPKNKSGSSKIHTPQQAKFGSQKNITKNTVNFCVEEIDNFVQKMNDTGNKAYMRGVEIISNIVKDSDPKMTGLNGFLKEYTKNTEMMPLETRKAYSMNKYNKLLWSAKQAKMARYDIANAMKIPFNGVNKIISTLEKWNSPQGFNNVHRNADLANQPSITSSSTKPSKFNNKTTVSKTALSKLQPTINPIKSQVPPVSVDICNAMINGKKMQVSPEKTIPLTSDHKKQIILAMLKEGKIPRDIVKEHEDHISYKNEEERIEKLTQEILDTYEVIVQEADIRPGTSGTRRHYATKNKKADKSEISDKKPPISGQKLSPAKTQIPTKTPVTMNPTPPIMQKEERKTLGSSISSKKPLKSNTMIRQIKMRDENTISKNSLIKACPINDLIQLINKYTALTIRNKEHKYDLKLINTLHKRLGLGKILQSEEDIKNRERMCQIKENLLRQLWVTINKENSFNYEENQGNQPKFIIGGGNNSPLVKLIMRERWWWTQGDETMKANLLWTQWRNTDFIGSLSTFEKYNNEKEKSDKNIRLCNHLEGNYYLGYKKTMYKCLLLYYSILGKDISEIVPLTFHIKNGKSDTDYHNFKTIFEQYQAELKAAESKLDEELSENESSDELPEKAQLRKCCKNVWILKPGENTNRGNGIMVSKELCEIEHYISDPTHTYIIQKYIERPLLFEKRKFDIRCYALFTSVNGFIKAYYYQEGYLRTASKEYSVNNLSKSVHLTNEAIQIKFDGFGKHEAGNKISYNEFQHYLEEISKKKYNKTIDFNKDILTKIKVFFKFNKTKIEYNNGKRKSSIFVY